MEAIDTGKEIVLSGLNGFQIILVVYLIIINIVTFVVFVVDKQAAIRHAWRVPEKTLLGLSAMGGSVGGMIAMRVAHHKTLHPQFKYGLPLMFVIQLFVLAYLFQPGEFVEVA